MTDIALIEAGAVVQVWRDCDPDSALASLPEGEHDLVEFEPGEVRCGMLFDGEALSEPPAPELPPQRRKLPKSTVTARLIDLGLIADTLAMLQADPVAYSRWFTPDWPNVYADDQGLLDFLAALGLTEEQIATVTAP